MKKLTAFIAMLLIATATFAQVPQGFSYQAVVRDAQNTVVSNKQMDITLTITANVGGVDVSSYSEKHSVTTNANGMFSLVVGKGASQQKFSDIKWNIPNAIYSMETVTEFGKGTTQLVSVPFAFYAAQAGEIDNAQLIKSISSTEVQSAISLVLKSDLADELKDYITSDELSNAINSALGNNNVGSALSNYATTQKLNDTLAYYVLAADADAAHANFVTKADLNDTLDSYVTKAGMNDTLDSYVTKAELTNILKSYAKNSDVNYVYDQLISFLEEESNAIREDVGNTLALMAQGINNINRAANTGRVNGKFSVSATKQVYFSNGNLQYQTTSGLWRFAEHQYDYVGTNNRYLTQSFLWIDLFGWGASGYSISPTSTSTTSTDYTVGGTTGKSLAGTNSDWGVYNKISNGGNVVGQWRTLTHDEMYYLLTQRPNSSYLYGMATVGNTVGAVLLPDDWKEPVGLEFHSTSKADKNVYTLDQWELMEANGAVFLPVAGSRYATTYTSNNDKCNYWLADSEFKYNTQYGMIISINNTESNGSYTVRVRAGDKLAMGAYYGYPVRLVQDVK